MGKTTTRPTLTPISGGQSPLAWGKREKVYLMVGNKRPIPACVGKTPNDDKHTAGPEAHPHLHGKNREFEKLHHLWLIPAFAGNGDGVSSRAVIMLTVPHFRCQVYGAARVNPNLRGKTHCIYLQIRRQPGQSPPCGKNSVIRCPGTV